MFVFLLRKCERDDAGGAAVEFALVVPVFLMFLIAVLTFGGWFWVSSAVQSLASEAARAAVGGLDTQEQIQLAHSYVQSEVESVGGGLQRAQTVTVVETTETSIHVAVTYDASDHPVFALAALTPHPPTTIRRTATVRTGGY